MVQRLTWRRAGQSDHQLKEYLILALLRSAVCVTLQDAEQGYLYIANLPDLWHIEPGSAPSDLAIFGADLAAMLVGLKAEALETGTQRKKLVELDEDRVFEFHVDRVTSYENRAQILTTIVDLSEKHRREKVLTALLREVSHRSKNLLAIILSMATQTARHSGTLEAFLRKFRGRLYSLSESQDLITDSSWRGARFRDLVHGQVDKYTPPGRATVRVEGDNVLLGPNAALYVGLAIHELAVNAMSHGTALSANPDIDLSCRAVPREGGGEMIEIVWLEEIAGSGAAAIASAAGGAGEEDAVRDQRFGDVVLERVVPNSVSGTAEYEITDHHIRYRLVFPRDA